MIIQKKLILASSSPSRANILRNCGMKFVQVEPTCNEEIIKKKLKKHSNPMLIAEKLSYEKAKSIGDIKKYTNHIVVGCDTLIYKDRKIFDKAKNIKEAKNKLIKLSGKQHKIISGLTILIKGEISLQCSETTYVKIRKLNSGQIDNYLKQAGKQILSSVGCYQIESLGPNIIEDIKGDFFNVMGFPLFKFLNHICKL